MKKLLLALYLLLPDVSLGWDLTLVHINDIHVRMEETNKYSADCRYNIYNITDFLKNKF